MIPRISHQLTEQLDRSERTIRIVWLALMISLGMYGFVIFQLSRAGGEPPPAPELSPLVPPVVALALAMAGTLMFRTLSSAERLRAALQITRSAEEDYELVPQAHRTPKQLEQLKALPDSERRLSRVVPILFTSFIVRWALFEAIAVIGVVLGIMHRSFEVFLPYGIAALALQALTPPSIKKRVVEAILLLPPDVRVGP